MSDATLIPDLLDDSPSFRIDVATTDAALVFAFAGSSSGGLFADALGAARVASSSFDASGFVDDLFLKEFVRNCFRVRVAGRPAVLASSSLVRQLSHPPSDRATIEFRRAITAELLGDPSRRRALGELYERLGRFRALIEATSSTDRWDPNRRQLLILAAFRDLMQCMARDFRGCTSGLARLASFASRVEESEAFRALVDLLRYDERLATLSFRVSIGADGRVRHLELDRVEEEKENPFVASPLRRWLAKFELLFRGFRFGEGEVMARLLDAVFEGVRAEFTALVQLTGDLEFYLGALGFAERAEAAGLAVCLPELVEVEAPRQFSGLFNPLLLGAGMQPVPCAIDLDRHDTIVLITGPNSGGKTRLLQSIGLSQLLAQSGLFVPAAQARLALTSGLVVSLIQETSADQTEGRLGVELVRIRELFERLPPGAVVLLDELCSGTNPSEGEEIFELVIRMLTKLRPQAFITTHFLAFAERLAREGKIPELRFLQVDLGPDHQPTYQFAPGVAATSLAGRAAARLGVTGEQLLALIEQKVGRAAERVS